MCQLTPLSHKSEFKIVRLTAEKKETSSNLLFIVLYLVTQIVGLRQHQLLVGN